MHAAKSECADFFKNICPKKAIVKKYQVWLICLSYRKTFWTMSVDNVGLKLRQLRTSNFVVTLIFPPSVNRSSPGTRSTTNHKFYRALERLRGPWCKRPLDCEHDWEDPCI